MTKPCRCDTCRAPLTTQGRFRRAIREAFTDDELDQARRLEAAMLPAPFRGRSDVRQSSALHEPCAQCATDVRPCKIHDYRRGKVWR